MSTPSKTPDSKKSKSREVRLGIVMYGGVSLAIYINGVAREFFDAVRGRGVYRLIKALTDSDIVVDVISGTSAGGINGVMLSYALCNNCEYSSAAALWRTHGDLGKLLHQPDDATNATSILNSEGYYQPKLAEVFAGMRTCAIDAKEDPSEFRELDLFVTSTNVNGATYTQFDDAGHPIDVKNHRAVFHLRHRKDRREPFAAVPPGEGGRPDAKSRVTFDALAKLSRATSCFPAAFAPVFVDATDGGCSTTDALLKDWGNLSDKTWFLDGGVLDNKPFTYTIKAISSRNAERAVSRRLFYVEPDPECMSREPDAKGPSILQSVLAALIGIPGYESIADDLKMIGERNNKLARYNRVLRGIFSKEIPAPTHEGWSIYIRCRLVALSERVLTGVFRDKGRDTTIEQDQRARTASLIKNFDDRIFDEKTCNEQPLDAFDVYFRHRRASRLIYLIHEVLYDAPRPDLSDAQRVNFQQLLCWLNCFIDIYDIVAAATERLVDESEIRWRTMTDDQVWDTVQSALLRLLQISNTQDWPALSSAAFGKALAENTCWLTPDVLTDLSARLRSLGATIMEDLKKGIRVQPDAAQGTILSVLDGFERRTVEHFTSPGDPVRLAADNFCKADAYLFPLEWVGDLREKDLIKTVRISPRDARRGFSDQDLDHKVAGDGVYHFGGFFKRSWRSNDILWGRLDGACQLIETLLDHERLVRLTGETAGRAKLADTFFTPADATRPRAFREELDPAHLFPKAGAATHRQLGNWLTDLLSADAVTSQSVLEKTPFETIVTLLVEAAQLEILNQDFPAIVTDAISEQAEWNLYKVASGPPVGQLEQCMKDSIASPFVFKSPEGTFDPFFASIAAAQRTEMVMRGYADGPDFAGGPRDTRLGRYFREEYKVGSEQLTRDIPTPVLLELLAHTLLVARNCILYLFPKPVRARITAHPFYKFGFDIPLRTFYAAVIFSRRAPTGAVAVGWSLAAMSLLALVISVVWFNSLIRIASPDGGRTWSVMAALLLIVLPLIILGTGAWFIRKLASRAKP